VPKLVGSFGHDTHSLIYELEDELEWPKEVCGLGTGHDKGYGDFIMLSDIQGLA
jgi:hypothetical protein